MFLFQQRLSVFPVDQGYMIQKMPWIEIIVLTWERNTEPRRKDKNGTAAFCLQSSVSAGVVDKKLGVVEDAEMMVSNDITDILCQIR